MKTPRILIVEDDAMLQRVIQTQIKCMGYDVSTAADVAGAREILREAPHDMVITDMNLPGVSGLDLLKIVRMEHPDTTVILVTAYGTVETAVEAMKAGAYDYLTKPLHLYELKALVNRVLERTRLIHEITTLRSSIDRKFGFQQILGRSDTLLHVLDAAAQVAPTDATILIRGETGTGKELLARAIHFNSPRRDRPFAVVNCGAIPRELLESELFGHVRGAFTGALTNKKGKVEAAEGGTVFLDEIGEMPLELQVRILRLVQEREIEKVGNAQQVKVDVRIIAATHRNLIDLVARGLFREDLYYRLSVIPLLLPALRDRPEDIPEFVQNFFEKSKLQHGKERLSFPSTLLRYFEEYSWPGNVRELENAVARMVLLARGDEITVGDLPDFLTPSPAQTSSRKSTPGESAGLDDMERSAIVKALRQFGGNQSQAARHLKISRKVLINRIAKYHIDRSEMGQKAD